MVTEEIKHSKSVVTIATVFIHASAQPRKARNNPFKLEWKLPTSYLLLSPTSHVIIWHHKRRNKSVIISKRYVRNSELKTWGSSDKGSISCILSHFLGKKQTNSPFIPPPGSVWIGKYHLDTNQWSHDLFSFTLLMTQFLSVYCLVCLATLTLIFLTSTVLSEDWFFSFKNTLKYNIDIHNVTSKWQRQSFSVSGSLF